MPDNYVFTGKDGVSRTFVGDRPPTPAEMAALESAEQPKTPAPDHKVAAAAGGAALAAIPAIARGVENLATSPNVAPIAAKAGRVIGGIAPIVAGAYEGGPVGALAGIAASAKGAWAGGKTGWFTGKMLQGMAQPVARVAQAVPSYGDIASAVGDAASAASPYVRGASGLLGFLDLAQMAEPKRQDIMGGRNSEPEQFAARLELKLKELMASGMSKPQALQALNDIVKAGR